MKLFDKNNNDNVLVSILIACYNGEKYIDRCIESCVNQTYNNIEIIFINDGSTDKSLEIISKWEQKDQRIKVISQKNQGIGATRNNLINYARGKYFTFVDVDDWLNKTSIQSFIDEIKEEDCDIVVGRSKFVFSDRFSNSAPFFVSWYVRPEMSNFQYIKSNICTPWASLINTNFFKSLNTKFVEGKNFEDLGLMTYIFAKAKKFKTIKKVVYYYYRHKKMFKKNISSFNSICFLKIDDIYFQINYLMSCLAKEKLIESKAQKRFIAGFLFQILIANILLLSNLTKNKYYRYLLNYDLIKSIYNHNLYIRFSKTPWKSLAFFYIYLKCFKVLRDSKNNKEWEKYINGSINDNKKISINKYDSKASKSSSNKIYEISIEDVFKEKYKSNLKNVNLALSIEEWEQDNVRNALQIIYKSNALPFVIVKNNNLTLEEFHWIWIKTFGLIIDTRIVDIEKAKIIINELVATKRKKPIYLIVDESNKEKVVEIKNIQGIFWDK